MRRIIASLCTCWLAYCGATQSNTLPLSFGMTPDQAAMALGTPLIRQSGRLGSEIYIAEAPAGVPGFYPTAAAIALQFRNGRLTGWKKDWQVVRRPHADWSF